MNHSAPSIKELIKLHNSDQTIRPLVNWTNAPGCRFFKLFTEKIHRLTSLPNAFNIKNTQKLTQNLNDTTLIPCNSLASLDINNMYSNISIVETKKIMTDILKLELLKPQAQHEILNWYDIITRQNYFTHNNDIISKYEGFAMGSPILRSHSRYIPTTHGTKAPSTHKTQALNHKLLQISR